MRRSAPAPVWVFLILACPSSHGSACPNASHLLQCRYDRPSGPIAAIRERGRPGKTPASLLRGRLHWPLERPRVGGGAPPGAHRLGARYQSQTASHVTFLADRPPCRAPDAAVPEPG